MGNFFHGWRRKAGCVTLAIACIFTAAWVRSTVQTDAIAFPPKTVYRIRSFQGGIERTKGRPTPEQRTIVRKDADGNSFEQTVQVMLFVQDVIWRIPYWSIVLPLTVFSVWLLLSKPRKPSTKAPEPAEAIGA